MSFVRACVGALSRGLVPQSASALSASNLSRSLSSLRVIPISQALRVQRAPRFSALGLAAVAVPSVGITAAYRAFSSSTSGITPHQKNWPRPGHPYGWIDAEAETLIAKAYQRHRALACSGASFPPSLDVSTEELERIGKPTHYPPRDFMDRVAYGSMRFLRRFVHAFFREKYDHHAVCLETVAAIPGQVAAFHRHLRSLRRMQRDHGFINPLLEESENERMHLLIWMKLTQPTPLERGIVILAQGAYLFFYSALYLIHPRTCHRLTGYLEEEAHSAYTDYLAAIDRGDIPTKSAPEIARVYYNLPDDATVRDVVLHVRADEAAHREFNHHIADKYASGDIDSRPAVMEIHDLSGGESEIADAGGKDK